MARVLNNEVSILNIASLDNDIKDSFTRAMISENENTTSVASKAYSEGEYFVHNDRYLYKALTSIAIGETITPNVNAEIVTVSEELVQLYNQSPEGIFEVLSNVETTSTASKNYKKGEQIIWTDKQLYKVIADIASGGAFVVGTNIALADNITSQMKMLADSDNAMLNVLGAKNRLPINNTSQTINNVTFTVNSDGSVTANGKANADTSFMLLSSTNAFVTNIYNNCILSGCPSGGSASGYEIIAHLSNNGSTHAAAVIDTGSGATITGNYPYIRVYLRIANGYTCSNLKFRPMIRPASIADDTYTPYTMTNRELTVNLNSKISGTRKYTPLLTSAESISAGATKSISLGGNTYNSFELWYYGNGGLRMSVILVSGSNMLVPVIMNNGVIDYFSISVSGGNFNVTNNSASNTAYVHRVYGINYN